MLLPLLGICALFGRFWGKSWEPVQGLLTDGCGCGDPRCCGNLFILCLFLLWQVRQRFRGSRNTDNKKGLKVSLLKWAVPPWLRLAIPVPSPGLSICPCTRKRLEIHVQKLVHRQKWGPPQKLRESWTQFLLSQLPGHTALEESGEPGICAPLFPSTCRCLEEYHKELYLLGGWQFAWGFCNIQAHLLCKVPVSQVLEGPGWVEQTQEKTAVIIPAPLPDSKGILLPGSPSTPETPCYSSLSIEGPITPVDQLVGAPETQDPEREAQQLAGDEGSLVTQVLRMEEGAAAGKDVLEADSQTHCSGGESHTYKDTSFPWGPALEDVDSEASEQELEAAEGSPHGTPRTQPLVQMWEGLLPSGKEERLQELHENFPDKGHRAGGGTGATPAQHQPLGSIALGLRDHDSPALESTEGSQALNHSPLSDTLPKDSNCDPIPLDANPKEVTSTHTVPPKRPALKKSSRLLLESLMRRKIAHLKWGLPRRIQESEWLFQLMGPSSPSNAGTKCSSSGEHETGKEKSKTQAEESNLREMGTQSSCEAGENHTCKDPGLSGDQLPKASGSATDPVQSFVQFKERLKCQEKEAHRLPMPPIKSKGKNGLGRADVWDLPISLDGAGGPKQSPNLWVLEDLCDEALSRAMLPVITDCSRKTSPWGGANRKQTEYSTKVSPTTMAREPRDSLKTVEPASPRSRESSSEPRPGPSKVAQRVFEKLGSPGPGAGMKAWSQEPFQKELNPKTSQDSQALPWSLVSHWSMSSGSRSQNISDSGGDTPQSQSSEAHLLPGDQKKRIFRSQGGRVPESGASSHSSGRAKGPFRTAAVRLGTAFMNKISWSPRQASSATSISNQNQCQDDPDLLREAGGSGILQTGLLRRSRDREEVEGPNHRGVPRGCDSVYLEREPQPPDQSFCDEGTGESSEALQGEAVPTKSSLGKRLRYLLTRLNFNK